MDVLFRSGLVKELGVDGLDSLVDIRLIQQDGDADLGGVDHLNVDARLIQRLEHLGGHAAVAHQACAYNRNLADVLICLDVVELQGLLVLVQDVLRLFQVLLMEGKG